MAHYDENHCPYDIWGPDRHTKINNVAFSCYAKHEQEKEDIINTIIASAKNGYSNFSIDLDDDFSDEDLEYIQSEVERRFK